MKLGKLQTLVADLCKCEEYMYFCNASTFCPRDKGVGEESVQLPT